MKSVVQTAAITTNYLMTWVAVQSSGFILAQLGAPGLELLTINRRSCTITEKALTRAFSWLKAATTVFTFKTLLRHYAKRALTPRSLNVKLGRRRKGHKGRAGWLA